MAKKETTPQDTRRLIPFNEAKNRYIFKGSLNLKDALHVGSGHSDENELGLVIRDNNGYPIIPGSSLRGVLRSSVERILAGLYAAGATSYWSCGLYSDDLPEGKFCIGTQSSHAESVEKREELINKAQTSGNDNLLWESLETHLCDTCLLFGASTFLASKIRFSDLPISIKNKHVVKERHAVGIHRGTGTAAPGIKYQFEVVDSKTPKDEQSSSNETTSFDFELYGENLSSVDLEILALVLKLLQSGEVTVGANSSRGLGRIQLDNECKVYSIDFETADRGKAVRVLTSFNKPTSNMDSTPIGDFVDANLKAFLA